MSTLVFVCPATGVEVCTGIEMEPATLPQLELSKVYCPHCRKLPHWLARVDLLENMHYETAKAA